MDRGLANASPEVTLSGVIRSIVNGREVGFASISEIYSGTERH
jgi:hypothetical protein